MIAINGENAYNNKVKGENVCPFLSGMVVTVTTPYIYTVSCIKHQCALWNKKKKMCGMSCK